MAHGRYWKHAARPWDAMQGITIYCTIKTSQCIYLAHAWHQHTSHKQGGAASVVADKHFQLWFNFELHFIVYTSL